MIGRFPRTLRVYLFLLLILVAASPAFAQVSLTTLGTPYTQNFDTLPASGSATWTNNSTIPGWFHARTGTGTTIVANDGSSNAGNLYSYGTGTATDRAFGSLGTGNAAIGNLFWGVRLQNNTGATITSLDVSYTGEQWRNSAAAAQTVAFSYLIGSPTVTGSLAEFQSAGVAVFALDFTSPITGGAAGALNGNLATNRVTLTFSITGLSVPNGTEIMLRWSDPDHTGADHGLSIDQFSVTPQGGVPLQADLAITKTDGVSTATAGGSVTYTITASNAGPSNASGATVADTFPAALTCTWTCVGAGGGICTAAGSGNISDTVNLPVGGSVTLTASCSISASATGTLSNTATVAAPAGVTDPTPGNNSATDTDTLSAQADLAITKTDGVTTATPGGSVTYTITASNAGPSNASGATVADTFPASLTCTWTCVGAGGGTCTASGSGNISNTVNLPAGGSVTYTASCSIGASATGTLSNTATVAAPADVTDPTPGNNSATDSDTLSAQADLAITKTDGVTTATPGGSVTYTITASNAGPSNASGATVADTFPASLTCTWTCVGAGGGTCTASGSGNINDTVNLPAGGSVTYTASCTVSPGATGTLSNTATVSVPAGVTDPIPANNSATDTDTLNPLPVANVSGTKTVSGMFTVGGSVTYTVVLTNSGTAVQGDNPGNEFTDVLPATLALVSATAPSGTAVANVGTATVTWNGSIPAGGSVTVTVNATILPAAAGTTVSNQGTIAFDNDGNGTNERSAQTNDPGKAGAADPTTFTVPGADLTITKTDGLTTAVPGGSVTYTIVASNAGPSATTGATVADTFPAALTCTWTCAGEGGGTCTATGAGHINDAVTLPVSASVTYTASCTIAPSARGSLSNTATVSTPAGVTDLNPGNNAVTDTDTLSVRGGCDVDGDGRDEIVTGAGPGGGPHVRVLNLSTGVELASFYAYDPDFGGGVSVACGDVDGDARADIVTGAGPGGGPHVRVFNLAGGLTEVASFYAYDPTFTGGVFVATGDVTGDGRADIVTGAGAGGGPQVRAFDLAGGGPSEVASFSAYDPTFTGDVTVAAEDLTGDGAAEIVTGAGAGGGPHVRVVSLAGGLTEVASFYAYDPTFTGGVFVAVGDVTGDGVADLITGAGAGGGPHVRVFDGVTGAEVATFFAYDPAFTAGVFVGAGS